MKKITNYFSIILLSILMGSASGLQAQLTILLVNDNDIALDRLEIIENALTNTGYSYLTWDIVTNGLAPSLEMMNAFDLVIWYTSKDGNQLSFWDNGGDNENIKAYIDNGGMFWVAGLDFLFDRYPNDEIPIDFVEGDFAYDYLGITEYHGQSKIDDGVWSSGLPELDLVDDMIFSINPMTWVWETLYYADALLPTDNATALYKMGPIGYDLDQYYSIIYNEKGDGKILTMAIEPAKLSLPSEVNLLFQEGCDYFSQFATTLEVPATAIEITAEGDATEITENFGSLQLTANLSPEDVSIPYVSWSYEGDIVVDLDQNGLLHASGTESGNGTVIVKASTVDGSNLVAEYEVTISNQGTIPSVLLVNDNNNGANRWRVIDTTLNDLGIIYNVYNIITESEIPSYDRLKEYDMIIWYTGNDGINLHLWEFGDDTLNTLRFNDPLMQYLNNGDGVVWLQGLDFMYDIFGLAPDWFSAGTFMYDYMGIDTYALQSHLDAGQQNLMEMTAVPGNPIASFSPVHWSYESGLWYADGFIATSNAQKVYEMHPGDLEGFYCGIYNEYNNSKIFTLAVETARFDTRENTDAFFSDILNHFGFPNAIQNHTPEQDFVLSQNIPNPASGQTSIGYQLKKNTSIDFSIINIMGQPVYEKHLANQSRGYHTIDIDIETLQLQSGIYTYTLATNGQSVSKKMIIQ